MAQSNSFQDILNNLPGGNNSSDYYDAETAKVFSNQNIRNNFVKKVLSLVGYQLMVTSGIIAVMMSYQRNLSQSLFNWTYYPSIVTVFVTYLAIIFSTKCRRQFP